MGDDYIWDLDGTLLDSYPVIVSSLEKAAREMGIPAEPDAILKKVKLDSVSGFLREHVESRGVSAEDFMDLYRRNCLEAEAFIRLTPGAAETLNRLREAGGRHFVYTHRGASTRRILEQLGILDAFEDIVTHEAGFPPKPAPDGILYLLAKHRLDPGRTWYAGDRALDIGCGVHAGVRTILYLEPGAVVDPTGREDRVVTSLMDI